MKINNKFIENKMNEINTRSIEIKDMQCSDRIDFLINKGCKYNFEYIYGIKYDDIISNTDNLMELSYYYIFHSEYNLKEFYTRLTKGCHADVFWIHNGLMVLEPVIKCHIKSERNINFKFQDIYKELKEKNSKYIESINCNKNIHPKSIKEGIILTAKSILEELSLYESDPLTYISNNKINLITLFVEDIEIYELEHYEFFKELSQIDNKELINFLNKFAINKFQENEIIKDMKINNIKKRLFGNL